MFVSLLRFGFAMIVFPSIVAAPAIAQCQNQRCIHNKSIQCFECVSGPEFMCRVDSCTSCTWQTCKSPGTDSPEGWTTSDLCAAEPAQFTQTPLGGAGESGALRKVAQTILPKQVALMGMTQPESPAKLVAITHTREDLFKRGVLLNTSKYSIASYRLGWVVVYEKRKPEVHIGMEMNVPPRIKPGATAEIPAQAVNGSLLAGESDAVGVLFFVFSVTFEEGGFWDAEVTGIERNARKHLGLPEQK